VIDMARTKYTTKMAGEEFARAKANELPISPKHAIEISNFIRGKKTSDAVEYLEDVVALKKAIPFKKFNRDVAHKKGLVGWDAGRYPVKASEAFIRLLHSVEANAEYIGLDSENLKIVAISANRGRSGRGFFARAMGRSTPKIAHSVNIEVIVTEVEA